MLRKEDVAVGQQRQLGAELLAEQRDLVPLRPPARPVVAPPAVDRERRDARLLDRARQLQRVVRRVEKPDLARDRHTGQVAHQRAEDVLDALGLAEQRGAHAALHRELHRAAHVDVDRANVCTHHLRRPQRVAGRGSAQLEGDTLVRYRAEDELAALVPEIDRT